MRPFLIWKYIGSVSSQLLLAQLTVAAGALIVNIFSARALGPAARGELALYMQIAYVINAISILGRHRAYLKVTSARTGDLRGAHLDIRKLLISPTIFGFILSALVATMFGNGLFAGIFLALGMFALVVSGLQQKTQRSAAIVSNTAHPYFFATGVGQVLMVIAAAFLALLRIETVAVWLVLYGLTVMLPYFLVDLWLASRRTDAIGESGLRTISRLGFKLMPTSVAEIVGARADRFLIPALSSFGQLGIYTVVVTMTELIAWPIKNFTEANVPNWGIEIASGRLRVFRILLVVASMICLMTVVVGFAVPAILVPLFGSDYAPGLELIWPLILAAGLHAMNHFGANLSLAAGYNGLANCIPVVGMLASIGGYFILIPKMGSLGAAWGLVFGYGIALVFVGLAIYRVARAMN